MLASKSDMGSAVVNLKERGIGSESGVVVVTLYSGWREQVLGGTVRVHHKFILAQLTACELASARKLCAPLIVPVKVMYAYVCGPVAVATSKGSLILRKMILNN